MSIKATAAAVALALAVSSPLYAQTAAKDTTATQNGAAAEHALQPGQVRASKMMGAKVYGEANNDGKNNNNKGNEQIATVKDLVIGHDGRVADVVLEANGRYVALPMSELQLQRSTDNNSLRFATNMTQDQLKSKPAFDLSARNVATGSSMPPAKQK